MRAVFLVAEDVLVTCAHVVRAVGSEPGGVVHLHQLGDEEWLRHSRMSVTSAGGVRALKHLNLMPGQTLLIHGAAGSVGVIAVQLATARGPPVGRGTVWRSSGPRHLVAAKTPVL